jgi:vWA-MoxR associated protein C-terminal domain/vWA-MoxR associated protein middle region 0/Effector-associated domain 2
MVQGAVAEGREFELERALVNALCRLSFMHTAADRQLFVGVLLDAVGDLPDIPGNSRMRMHVLEIVRACLGHPRGLHGLVRALELIAPGQVSTAEVMSLVQSFTVLELLPRAERQRVQDLLGRAEYLDAEALWYAAADEMAPPPTEPVSTLGAAFEHLARLNARPDGLPPSLAFVEYAAVRVTAPLSTELRRWNDIQAGRLDVAAELSALRQRAAAESTAVLARPCLVIQLQEHGIDSGRYILSSWTQRRPGPWHPQRGEDQLVTLDSAERTVESLVNQAESIWGKQPGRVVLEFILPATLINEAVDWWRTNSDSVEAIPFCLDYPIIIRSLERMRDQSCHRFWRNRWQTMQAAPGINTNWSLGEDIDIGLWNARLRSDETIAAVALGAPPAAWSPAGRLQLKMALRAGIPIIIWDRRERRGDNFRESVDPLLGGPPMTLADRVQEFRSQAATADVALRDAHLGRHLAVLWDDPHRLVDIDPYIPFIQNEPAEEESGDE